MFFHIKIGKLGWQMFFIDSFARLREFESPTFGSGNQRSIQLVYTRIGVIL
ncbi:uncharacterized protein METZ01_LOCUS451475, partial [marine metagenome]